jgi:hypothetical protein
MAKIFYPGKIQVLCGLRAWTGGVLAKLTPKKKNQDIAKKDEK